MPPSSCGSCTVAILGRHKKIRHLQYESCWPKYQLVKNREKMQMCAGILCWASWCVSFSSCYIAEVTPMRKAMGQGQGCFRRSLKPLSVARGVWWTLRAPGPLPGAGTSWDCSAPAPSQGSGRAGDTPGAPGWGSDPSAWGGVGCWAAIAQEELIILGNEK